MWWAFAAGIAHGICLFLVHVIQEEADASQPDAESADAAGE